MDFFAQQDAARAASRRFVWVFAFMVLVLVVVINVIARFICELAVHDWYPTHALFLHLVVTGGTLAIVGFGWLTKWSEFSGGGAVVATSLGAKSVTHATSDEGERRLLNVVEEMAIAAGIPVPAVFVLNHEGINAFAAGLQVRDAAVAVTRGCLRELSRAELQGVIGHEMSHLLNGDTRLNMRLLAAGHGLSCLAAVGEFLLRTSGRSGGFNRDRNQRQDASAVVVAAGVGLLVIGLLGAGLAYLLRAAVSRQREYLADASAVQFTRDHLAVAGALKKALQPTVGTKVTHPNAEAAAHLFFAAPTRRWTDFLASHPPLRERIIRLDPGWNGEFTPVVNHAPAPVEVVPPPSLARVIAAGAPIHDRLWSGLMPSPAQVDFAAQLLAALPDELRNAAGARFDARAVALVTVLSDLDPAQQLERIRATDIVLAAIVERLRPAWIALGDQRARARLPLLQLALASLTRMTPSQRAPFLTLVHDVSALGEATNDRLTAELLEATLNPGLPVTEFHALKPLLPDAAVVIAALARVASDPQAAFAHGWSRLLMPGDVPELPPDPGVTTLAAVLAKFARANAAIRRRVVDAAAHAASADGRIDPPEAERLRLICARLGLPLPIFRDGG